MSEKLVKKITKEDNDIDQIYFRFFSDKNLIETDPFDENTIYATVSGFRWDESEPHVFKSTDLGENWTSISGNLPELPVNVIRADLENEGYLFVGTDAGVFYTEDGGDNWVNIMNGLPNVPVTAMKIHNPTRKLVIGTYGISMYSLNIDHLVAINEKLSKEVAELKCYPNPSSVRRTGNITIEINSQFDENSLVEIIDISGKRVKILNPVVNNNKVIWDATNQAGIKVDPGIYIINVVVNQLNYSQKIQLAD